MQTMTNCAQFVVHNSYLTHERLIVAWPAGVQLRACAMELRRMVNVPRHRKARWRGYSPPPPRARPLTSLPATPTSSRSSSYKQKRTKCVKNMAWFNLSPISPPSPLPGVVGLCTPCQCDAQQGESTGANFPQGQWLLSWGSICTIDRSCRCC